MLIRHLGEYKFEVEERGLKVITDQPPPSGENAGMMPVDFLGAALGSCVAVYAADFLKRNKIPTDDMRIELNWQGADRPKRIGSYDVRVKVPHQLTDRQQASLSRVIKGCTVHNTLEHPPEIKISLVSD
jgi:putative redox protein